jgi:putative SOS response-associated peptidase YedK
VRRFTQAYTWAELVAFYRLTQPAMNLQRRYNIAPTATIDVLIPRNSDQLWQNALGPSCTVPQWWKKSLKELPSTFNARAETITGRPMFRDAFRERRCIIPAWGYYEADADRQAALLHFRPRRLDTALCRIMGRMARPGKRRAGEVVHDSPTPTR